MKPKIVIYGCGGHSKVVADVIRSEQVYEIACYFDDHPQNNNIDGVPIFSTRESLLEFAHKNDVQNAAIAIGNNEARKKLFLEAKKLGFSLPTLIHTTAIVSKIVDLGLGTVVMPGVIINAAASIGNGVILNTGVIIEHDCRIDSFTHIAPGSVLCGGVSVGELTLVGASSVAIPLMKIGSNVTVGAGSVIVRNIGDHAHAYGNPAREKISTVHL